MSLSKQQIEDALIKTNGKCLEAAKLLGVKASKLYWHINRLHIVFKNQKPPIDFYKAQLLYDKYQSLSLVAKELGCSKEGVRLLMGRHGVPVNEPIRYSFDERFFSKDSEEVFYWAGFIAADGCLVIKKDSYALEIGLGIKDRSHLELFKKHISAEHPIHEYFVKRNHPNYNDTMKAEIRLLSKYLPGDFARFNIVPRKTKIYTFPEWLIDHPFLNHFMRGYFDGDGSWYVGPTKVTPQICFNILGTPEFIRVYRAILEEHCLLSKRTKDIRIYHGLGVLEYGGNGVVSKIRDFLYRDSTVFLSRKFNLVKDIVPVERLCLTPEFLIERMRVLGEQKAIAKELGCSRPNISRYVEKFGIRDQMKEAKKQYLSKVIV